MNNAIFITVRTSSTRLPKKCLLEINGIRVINHLITRLKQCKIADGIILCTTTNVEDNILCEIAENADINYFRGSENDKLDRWQQAAKKYNVECIVTADGDDVFCEPILIDMAFKQLNTTNIDFIEEKPGAFAPVGAFSYAFKVSALNKVCEIKNTDDTEMMSVYFTDTGLFSIDTLHNIPKEFNRPEIRMTLDYEDDFKFFKNVIENISLKEYTLYDIISYIDKNIDVIQINQHLNKDFLENQKRKRKLIIK